MSDTTDSVTVVFDMETFGSPLAVGNYVGTDEDTITYVDGRQQHRAPADCVEVITVPLALGNLWARLQPYQKRELIETARAMLAPVPQSLRA